VPYSTICPAIFSASLLAAAREVRASRTWDRPRRQRPHGLDRPSRRGRGRAARAHRPGAMGRAPRPDRTGPAVVAGGARATFAGVPAGTAELLIAREWAILAGENDYTTDTFQQTTRPPPTPGGRVPSRLPRGIPLIPARQDHQPSSAQISSDAPRSQRFTTSREAR
jgi:hypothetical protein